MSVALPPSDPTRVVNKDHRGSGPRFIHESGTRSPGPGSRTRSDKSLRCRLYLEKSGGGRTRWDLVRS